MRQFVVSEARVSRVAKHAREIVEEAGGIVAKHSSRRTEFDHLDYGDEAWRRAGYVGTYQRFKEKPVQVRVRVWAQWPRRLLTGSVYLGFALALVFFLASLIEITFPPNVWIFTALPILAVIATAFLMYTSSREDSQRAEHRIETELVERIREDEEIPGEIYEVDEWEDYRETLVDEARQGARAPAGDSRIPGAVSGLGDSLPSLGSSETDADEQPVEADAGEDEDAMASAEEAEGEEAPEPEAARADGEASDEHEEETTDSDSQGTLAALTSKLGLGGEDEPEDPEAADEEAEPDDVDAEELEASEDTEEASGSGALAGLKAKLGLGDEEDVQTETETVDETEPEPAEGSEAAST